MKSRIQINKLILCGSTYKRTLEFKNNLTLIRGDGFSGKSLVLKLIAYCMGSKSDTIDLDVQKELADNCDEVFIELKINDVCYTLNRHLKYDKNILNFYLSNYEEHKDYSPWKKNADDTNDFLAKEMQIPLHNILRKKSGSKDLQPEKISFRDVMRFIYIGQGDLGTNQFMQYANSFVSGKNKEVFKIINDLVIPDLEEINQLIQIKQNEKNRLENVNDGMNEYLKNRDALVLTQLVGEKEKLTKEINKLSNEKKKIVNNRKQNNTEIFSGLRNDILHIENIIGDNNQSISQIKLSILNKNNLLLDYIVEQEKLAATLEAMKKIKIKDHSEFCPLCHSVIEIVEDENSSEDIEKALEQIIIKKQTLSELVEEDETKLQKVEKENVKLIEKKMIYDAALQEYKSNMEVPYLSEIETYNSLIKDLTDEKNKLSTLIDIYHDIEMNKSSLDVIEEELSELEKKKGMMINLQQREVKVFNNLNSKYRVLMQRFKFEDTQENSCYISNETFLPYYNGISILKHTSGCLLLCMQIAYIGAILELNLEDENNCHPALLMLDTVSNNIGTDADSKDSIDPETYSELFEYLGELSVNNQLFIVDNTPPEISKEKNEFVLRRVKRGQPLKGLIDFEVNEFVENSSMN